MTRQGGEKMFNSIPAPSTMTREPAVVPFHPRLDYHCNQTRVFTMHSIRSIPLLIENCLENLSQGLQ